MPLESRLKRKSFASDTYKDDRMANKEDSPLDEMLGVLAASAGLYALYKKGMLKDVAKKGLEVFNNVAQENMEKPYMTLETIKKWAELEKLNPAQLKDEGLRLPTNSLFRGKNLSKLKELGLDTLSEIQKGDIRLGYARKIIDETAQDVTLLKRMIEENQSNANVLKEKFRETDLMNALQEMRRFSREVSANGNEENIAVLNAITTKELVSMRTLTPEMEAQQMKLKGYRPVMLKDIMERPTQGEDGNYIYNAVSSKINLEDGKVFEELMYTMDNFNYRYMNSDGKVTTLLGDWDNTKRLVLDDKILIDETGNIIDLRMSKRMTDRLKRSIVTDFQIPVLGSNPLAGIFRNWSSAGKKPFTGIVSKNDIQPFITGRTGRISVGDVYGDDLYVINHKLYKLTDNGQQAVQIGDNFNLNDITNASEYGFNRTVDITRKMGNLEYYEYSLKDWAQDAIDEGGKKGKAMTFLDKMFTTLDSSKGENYVHKYKFNPEGGIDIPDDKLFTGDIDSFFTNLIYKAGKKINIYEETQKYTPLNIFGEGPMPINDGKNIIPTRRFIVTKKGANIRDIEGSEGLQGKFEFLKQYGSQLIAGRYGDEIAEDTTELTMGFYNLFDNVLTRFASIAPQLGFSLDSKGNILSYLGNVMAKRVLPIYAITQAPEMLNALSEPIFNLFGSDKDGTGNKNNITKFVTSEIVKPLDLGLHKVKDSLGFFGGTNLWKKAEEFIPGFDQFNELPGIYNLGLTQSHEEREEYIEKGYDPVRKSRYWSLGNTPFTGGKIMYWRPNLYRRIEADVDFSDSKWGSRQEYYSNTWYPNLINPLAPINHFILDRHHYDKKHYHDRPYLLTSQEGVNIPIVGPLYANTIGNVINPQRKMHREYWKGGTPIERDDESVAIIDNINQQSMYQRQMQINNDFINSNIFTYMDNSYQSSQLRDAYSRMRSTQQAQYVTQHSSSPQNVITGNILPSRTDNLFTSFMGNMSDLEIYTTPSGATSVIDIPDTLTTVEANQRLREYSIKRFAEATTRVNVNDPNRFAPQLADYSNETINNSFIYGIGEQYNTVADFFGMKGFETQAFITGKANENARVIEDSSYAYSFNKEFWDQNLGGFGGDASEIFRRFVQKRNTSTEYVNPIRNTMPSWMPGRDYFTDFKHGDPYSKVENGEERLPGEGYERLHRINSKKMFDLGIGSSYIGKTKEDMVKHLLNQDSFSSYSINVMEEGNKVHEQVEKAWLESGLAIEVEGRVEDKQNNILGFYDALIHDSTSKTGKAIVDIKTVGDKKFQRIVAQGHADFEHQSQTNYYLWATGNKRSNGYIYYINRDNPEQTYTAGFHFDSDLLRQNLNTLNQARNEIYTGLENGSIGRGELYSDIDKYRILADVAPYSDEFQSIKAKLANDTSLSPQEREEISQINKRVTMQKEPLRVYPYKFTTSNLKQERVRVKKIIDNNTILVNRYGTDHAIKLAGIRVSESNSEMYNKEKTMNEAAARELRKHIRRGKTISIAYDFDEANKYKNDSTKSIRAVVYSDGRNVNQIMLNKGFAKENENDNSPAGINARYTKNEVAFGSAMERITHFLGNSPIKTKETIMLNKMFQVKSPYEQYRDKEVYGKDFQSWTHPIRDYLVPEAVDKVIARGNRGPEGILGATVMGAFIGSLFGATKYGKLLGSTAGATIGLVGGTYANSKKTTEKDWVPERRREQQELNEYFDMLKYVKNMGLYEKYKQKALKEDHIDVDEFEGSNIAQGIYNKNRAKELKEFKKVVKLDYKHRKQFDFKYGEPEGLDMSADPKSIIRTINQELNKIQSDRTVERMPENVIKALSYKQQSEQTMYGYDAGEPLNNLMAALPKKERQYFNYFMDAPEEEKEKILRIAPDYLRRGLQQAWGMKVDEKPSLVEYFTTHGLPDAGWVGWDEETNIEDVKVKLVHSNKLDMGEFDLWDEQIEQANQAYIPVPKIRSQNSNTVVQLRLQSILGKAGYEDVAVTPYYSAFGNKNTFDIYQDSRDDVSNAIYSMNI